LAFIPAVDGRVDTSKPVVVMDCSKGGLAEPRTAREMSYDDYIAEAGDRVTPHPDDAPPVTAAPDTPATPAAPERLAETLPAAREPSRPLPAPKPASSWFWRHEQERIAAGEDVSLPCECRVCRGLQCRSR
jgi:hypothetical protein